MTNSELINRVLELEKELVEKYGGVTAQGMAESALNAVKYAESFGCIESGSKFKSKS